MADKWADFRYAVGNSKLGRRITTALLIATMAISVALTAAACDSVTIKDNGDGSYTVTPNGGNQNGNQGGNNQGDGNNNPKPAPDYSKYSPLLQEVLANPEYDALYSRYESNELFESTNHYDPGSNLMEAIPYEFLASKGEDIEGIKNGSVWVNSNLFTKENEKDTIYDRLQITYEVKNGENYINQYLLKYEISEQELDDLKMLYNGRYYQGPVMFQNLASKQQPEVISEFSINENVYKKLLNNWNNEQFIKDLFGGKAETFIVTNIEQDSNNSLVYYLTINVISENNGNAIEARELAEARIKINWSANVSIDHGILNMTATNKYDFISSTESTPITYFQLDFAFKNIKTL